MAHRQRRQDYLIDVINDGQMPQAEGAKETEEPRERGAVRQRVRGRIHERPQVYRARLLPLRYVQLQIYSQNRDSKNNVRLSLHIELLVAIKLELMAATSAGFETKCVVCPPCFLGSVQVLHNIIY